MSYTVVAPKSGWLGKSEAETLQDAVQLKLAWKENQNADAVILDEDGYIVSAFDQRFALGVLERLRKIREEEFYQRLNEL